MRGSNSLAIAAVGLTLAACGGGSSPGGSTPPPPPAPTYSVSGTVSGLTGSVVLRVNDASDLTVSANGAVTIATALANGASWSVTVKTQPTNPTQQCAVSNGSGTIAAAGVSNVSITCADVPLTLASSTPADHATNVTRAAPLTLTFSTTLDSSTVAAAASLTDVAGAVPATVSASANQLVVTPAHRLTRLGAYTLTVSTALRGAGGERLAAPVVLGFTSADGSWSEPVTLETGAGAARDPRIALDAAGNALAVWSQLDGTRASVYSNHSSAGAPWEGAIAVDSSDTQDAITPDVRFDANGNALAVWAQGVPGSSFVWSSRFYGTSTWGTPERIDTESGPAISPEVAIDAAGNALAAWTKLVLIGGSAARELRASQFTLAAGWSGTAQSLGPGTLAYFPHTCFDDSGKALAIWYQNDIGGAQIWGNAFVPGTGWGTAAPIEKIDGRNADQPQIACNPDGSALAVWRRQETGGYFVHAATYSPSAGWSAPTRLDSGDSSAGTPLVAADARGNAIVIWTQPNATSTRVWSRRHVVDSGWTAVSQVDGPDEGNSAALSLAMNARGDGIAAWVRVTGGGTARVVRAARMAAGADFGAPEDIDRDATRLADNVRVAVDATGNAVAVWEKGDGTTNDIQAARFD